jgi:hypothetical protein
LDVTDFLANYQSKPNVIRWKHTFVILTMVEFAMAASGCWNTVQEWNMVVVSCGWVMGHLLQRSMTAKWGIR